MKIIIKLGIRIFLFFLVFIISLNSLFSAQYFQMEWNKTSIPAETWTQINFTTFYEEPIVVATPEYLSTTQAFGISTWITNVTNTSFMLRTSDENLGSTDNITTHYIVIEAGSWNLPNSSIQIEAGKVNTNKVGVSGGGNHQCPTYGEVVTFQNSFNSNPLVISTRGSNNNPNSWAASFQNDPSSQGNAVTSNQMCIGLTQSKASSPGTITNNEDIYWVAIDEGNGSISTSEFEVLWNLKDTGDSGGNWINGYGDGPPFTQSWSHTWVGAPNIILTSITSTAGSDGGWGVTYDTGNTGSIRVFVDEPNERSHGGSESGGGFAFNHSSSVIAPNKINWDSNSLDLGFGVIIDGNLIGSLDINSYKSNNNIDITCISGNCSIISTNFTSINLNSGELSSIDFSCQNQSTGFFNAIFKVNSSEDGVGDNLNVSCRFYKEFGDLNITLISPTPNSLRQVAQNRTFNFQSSITCNGDVNISCGNVTLYARYNGSLSSLGDGSDGSLIISSPDTIINNYTYLTSNVNSGNNVITVNNPLAFSINDEILIIQMQNGTGTGVAGNFEFKRISSISGSDFTLESNLENNYGSGTFNSLSSSVTQVIRVPQFTSLNISSGSITSPSWDGFSGGIVVFRSQETVDLTNGVINVSQKGFRGGDCNGCGNNAWGDQGESTIGVGSGALSNNGIGGGGGYGPSGYNGEPGAGGGHATAGENGVSSFSAIGGSTIGFSNLSQIFFGGGAGGGGDDDSGVPAAEYSNGGGIVMLFTNQLINANILSLGRDAFGSGGAGGVTGGGAGGSIWISAQNLDINNVDVSGGSSFDDGGDYGGAGGDGRLRLDFSSISGNSPVINSGFNGSLTSNSGMIYISNTSFDTPMYSISAQPQYCLDMKDGDVCILNWEINATGKINSSFLIDVTAFSNVPVVTQVFSQNFTLQITDNIIPLITLISPLNNEKIITSNQLNLSFRIEDDDLNLSCFLYINDLLNQSSLCNTYQNLSFTKLFSNGDFNWKINVIDSLNNSVNSSKYNFTIIQGYNSMISKSIIFENSNQYLIKLNVSNKLVNSNQNNTLIDFVPNSFSYGSFSLIYDFFNSISSFLFNGDSLIWNNYHINNSNSLLINYSVSGLNNNYSLGDLFIISLE